MDRDGCEYTIDQENLCLESEWREDHVAVPGKVIDQPENLIGRIVVIKGPDSSPWKGWMGQIVSPSITGEKYVVKLINGAMYWPLVGHCELLPSELADGWKGLTDAMKAGIAWGISGKLTTLAEHKAKRQAGEGETVDHPKHYNDHPSGIECIEIVEHENFCIGNAMKYLWRADHKGNALEDLKKAAWYVQREIDRRERQK